MTYATSVSAISPSRSNIGSNHWTLAGAVEVLLNKFRFSNTEVKVMGKFIKIKILFEILGGLCKDLSFLLLRLWRGQCYPDWWSI